MPHSCQPRNPREDALKSCGSSLHRCSQQKGEVCQAMGTCQEMSYIIQTISEIHERNIRERWYLNVFKTYLRKDHGLLVGSLSRFNTVAPELLHPNHPRSSKPWEWHAANDCLVVVGKTEGITRPELQPKVGSSPSPCCKQWLCTVHVYIMHSFAWQNAYELICLRICNTASVYCISSYVIYNIDACGIPVSLDKPCLLVQSRGHTLASIIIATNAGW